VILNLLIKVFVLQGWLYLLTTLFGGYQDPKGSQMYSHTYCHNFRRG